MLPLDLSRSKSAVFVSISLPDDLLQYELEQSNNLFLSPRSCPWPKYNVDVDWTIPWYHLRLQSLAISSWRFDAVSLHRSVAFHPFFQRQYPQRKLSWCRVPSAENLCSRWNIRYQAIEPWYVNKLDRGRVGLPFHLPEDFNVFYWYRKKYYHWFTESPREYQ